MRKTGAFAALLFLLTLGAIGTQDAARATSFVPIDHTVSLSNSAPSTNSNLTVSITLDSPAALDQVHVSFIPSAWSVANDAAIPNGAIVGNISLGISESVSNGPCNDSKFLGFTLFDATTNTASNLLADTPRIPSSSWPGFTVVNGVPDAVNKYPTFLKNAYPGLTPRSRAYGSVPAAIGGINRVVNVLVFEPGTLLPGMSPISASFGYIVVVVPQDPTAPAVASTITDQCSAFIYTRQDRGMTLDNPDTNPANEGGVAYRTNPATPGTYKFSEYFRSHRDFDSDGIENPLDTCPYVSTPSWNPRISDAIYDPDGDGTPGQDDVSQPGEQLVPGTGCDPTPATPSADPDADGFANRQDNCPLIANGTQADPDADGIGSACDVVDTAPDGHLHEVCSSINVDVGTPGTPATLTCPAFVLDMDSDGFSDQAETWVGTNSLRACDATGATAPNPSWPGDISASGTGGYNRVNLADITSFTAPAPKKLNTKPGDAGYNVRWDLNPNLVGPAPANKTIVLGDLTTLTAGGNGSPARPPMFEGARAFSGPLCPWP